MPSCAVRQSDNRKRVVVAGLGDTGVLTAIHLSRHADVVGISVKPALVSGQELGVRLSRPDDWARDYWIAFDRFRRLDRVRTVHAALAGVDFAARKVFGQRADGFALAEEYDALVIATGVANGFWRRPTLQSQGEIGAELRAAHDRLAAAKSVIVVGGGAAAVSSAANLAMTWPATRVGLYFPGERALVRHHPRTWETMFWPSSAVGRCALSVRRNGDGVPCLASSPTDSRSSAPPVMRSASRRGRPTAC